MAYGCFHATVGFMLGCIIYLIGTPWGVIPILPLAFISHFPLDDLNFGDVMIGHMMEEFTDSWYKRHLALRIVWWCCLIALLIVGFIYYWLLALYALIGAIVACSWDFDWVLHTDIHGILRNKFFHDGRGSFVFYISIFACCIVAVIMAMVVRL